MVFIKTESEIDLMREGGKITAGALRAAEDMIRPGVTTAEISDAVRAHIVSCGAKPSFEGYGGFPAAACVSINDEIVHGIPNKKRVVQDGDIVSVDVGSFYKGFHTDAARTFLVGNVSDVARKLVAETKQSFFEGIRYARLGNRLSDISSHIQQYAEGQGFSVVRELVGHGIGINLHESPDVPNYGRPGRGIRLCEGMCLAVEPMINEGVRQISTDPDGWTTRTLDGKLSAHYENTIVITNGEPLILTLY